MAFLLYDILLMLAAIALAPYALIKGGGFGHLWRGLGERFAIYSKDRLEPLAGKQVIWVHAVSVGETRASIPLLRQLRSRYPDAAIVLSCLTFTGRAMADEVSEADLCIFLPYDVSWVVNKALRQLHPDMVLLVETELWPNLIRKLHENQIPSAVVNGRISDRSFPKYWLVRPLLKPLLQKISRFCMQSRQDALRITHLGACSDSVMITGNLKFDLPAPNFSPEKIVAFRNEFGLSQSYPVWVAGSTRQGEEEIILDAYEALIASGKELFLVLVPRHPERVRSVCELIDGRGFKYILRSELPDAPAALQPGEILVVDTMGEMLKFYACADIVFVGGSLVPIGGHNILEASMLQKPVLFGPHMQNFRQITKELLAAGGGLQTSGPDLADDVGLLLGNDDVRGELGRAGAEFFAQHAGATERTVDEVASFMEAGG